MPARCSANRNGSTRRAARSASSATSSAKATGCIHSYREGQRQYPAYADGYANMARAALALWEATGERDYLERAIAWTKVLDEQFWDIVQGGYVFSKNPDLPGTGADANRVRLANAFVQRRHDRRAWPDLLRHRRRLFR